VKYSSTDISEIIGGTLLQQKDVVIQHITVDSRKIVHGGNTLFAALKGSFTDGHHHIRACYDHGVRCFLVSDKKVELLDGACYIWVPDVVIALQLLAAHHRKQFAMPVLAITGSNGKTIIKEWLYQMLYSDHNVVKSPKSYNSQIGVPLSLYRIDDSHELAIMEAGISRPREMDVHARMIQPTVGIFTNIGDAHQAAFDSLAQKIAEKAKLFQTCKDIICCLDHKEIYSYLRQTYNDKNILAWSRTDRNSYLYAEQTGQTLAIYHGGASAVVHLNYTDPSAVENIMHCIAFLLYRGVPLQSLSEKVQKVSGLSMRLEMKAGINQSVIINDAYSADLSALKIALEFMALQHPDKQKLLILGKLEQSGMTEDKTLQQVQALATKHELQGVHYISDYSGPLPSRFTQYGSKQSLIDSLPHISVSNKVILIKGPRSLQLEQVVHRLSHKGHSTTLTIDLDALAHNVKEYKSTLRPTTEIIAVIKAAAYGTGSVEVASLLGSCGVSKLAVAFVDEAIALRQQGVTMPIIVFNADIMSLADVHRYSLELEVYTREQLSMLGRYAATAQQNISIHLKLDTGMHRLGFTQEQLPEAISLLQQYPTLHIASIFSHLASSEDAEDDQYTQQQFATFDDMYETVCTALQIAPKRHILNSSGISRFQDRQYDMVRLGLGLYGIDSGGVLSQRLQKVHTLTSTLLQVKPLHKGDSIGYNRKTILEQDTLTGVVNIGYADGLLRNLGNRRYAVVIDGKLADIIGTVSMDLIIVDLSQVHNPHVGMPVTIFDESHTIENLAAKAGTIPYEVLSRISERVERVYIRS